MKGSDRLKILILTAKFGMGHVSASEAIREEMLLTYPDARIEIVDMIDYLFPHLNKWIYAGFNFMVTKCSFIYNIFNKITARYSHIPFKKIVTYKIEQLLKQYEADCIVTTCPVCPQYISTYKEMTQDNIPLYTYITDIMVHEEWIASQTDFYFVGAEKTKLDLLQKGVLASKIKVCGIPVKQCFKDHSQEKIDKSVTKHEVLIMGGGLGLISSPDHFLKQLSRREDIKLTMITGHNIKLYNRVKKKFPGIEVIGFTNHVADYMKRADLLVTKSGGITMFEAIHTQTPLYIVNPFLIQEIENAKYIEEVHIGKVIWSSKRQEITRNILELLENMEEQQRMKANMKSIQNHFANSSSV